MKKLKILVAAIFLCIFLTATASAAIQNSISLEVQDESDYLVDSKSGTCDSHNGATITAHCYLDYELGENIDILAIASGSIDGHSGSAKAKVEYPGGPEYDYDTYFQACAYNHTYRLSASIEVYNPDNDFSTTTAYVKIEW